MERQTSINSDHIARVLAEVEAEYHAALDERARLPEGDRHEAVSRRMENMSRLYERLQAIAGVDALRLLVEHLEAISAQPCQKNADERDESRMYCLACGIELNDANQDGLTCHTCKQELRERDRRARLRSRSPQKKPYPSECVVVRFCYDCGRPYQPVDASIRHPSCIARRSWSEKPGSGPGEREETVLASGMEEQSVNQVSR